MKLHSLKTHLHDAISNAYPTGTSSSPQVLDGWRLLHGSLVGHDAHQAGLKIQPGGQELEGRGRREKDEQVSMIKTSFLRQRCCQKMFVIDLLD